MSASREMDDMVERVRDVLCTRMCSARRREGKCTTEDGSCLLHASMTEVARAAIEATPGWQPIDTAPKDGTAVWLVCDGQVFIGYCEAGGRVPWQPEDRWRLKASFTRQDEAALSDDVFACYVPNAKPTHWQPLPEPPALTHTTTDRREG
jgi:hypothetical protein